jgi:hypothetical protein
LHFNQQIWHSMNWIKMMRKKITILKGNISTSYWDFMIWRPQMELDRQAPAIVCRGPTVFITWEERGCWNVDMSQMNMLGMWHLSIVGHVGQSLMWLFPDHSALLPLLSLE